MTTSRPPRAGTWRIAGSAGAIAACPSAAPGTSSSPDPTGDGVWVDLGELAATLELPLVDDLDADVAALGEPADRRADDLRSLEAPDFTLPDLDDRPVSLSDYSGRKRLLLAWASW